MNSELIRILACAIKSGYMVYSAHYRKRFDQRRATPTRAEVAYILCDDEPMILEENPNHPLGPTSLIWGKTEDGRVGHVICANPPDNTIVTAYFPADTQPEKWDSDFITRKGDDL